MNPTLSNFLHNDVVKLNQNLGMFLLPEGQGNFSEPYRYACFNLTGPDRQDCFSDPFQEPLQNQL